VRRQVGAIRVRGSSHGVSAATYAVLLVGFVLWGAYGVAAHNALLIVPNVVAGIVGSATLVVIRRYRDADAPIQEGYRRSPPPAPDAFVMDAARESIASEPWMDRTSDD